MAKLAGELGGVGMNWRRIAWFTACAGLGWGSAEAAVAPPPASAFGRLPAIEHVDISPDGQRIAYVGGQGDQRFIAVAPVDGTKVTTARIGADVVRSVRWAGDGLVLIRTSELKQLRDNAAGGAFTYHFARDFVLTPDLKVVTYLLRDNPVSELATSLPVLQLVDGPKPTAIVQGFDISSSALMGPDDTHIRSKEGDADHPFVATLYRVDVASGTGTAIEHGSLTTTGWDVDAQGQPRVRFENDYRHGASQILVRPKGAGAWRVLARSGDTASQPLPEYLGYSDPDDSVYLIETADGRDRVVRHALASGVETPVPETDAKVVTSMTTDPYSGVALGLTTDADRAGEIWLDPAMGSLHAKLEHAFPGRGVGFADWSKDRSRIVVSIEAPDFPTQWFLLDAAKGQLSPIGSAYPELSGASLGQTRWIAYKARDGLQMGAYLTLPPAGAGSGKPPLVVLPHGGPASRDEFEFDWWAQFLATRGYAVLQPQFRGSSGFGLAFETAGRKEWAGKMQTDLLDGVAAVAAQGGVDTTRICIVGASYGGYAALAGAAFHPEAYGCAVSVNGVSDLALLRGEELHDYGAESAGVGSLKAMLGQGGDLAAASPDKAAAQVRAPVLLVVSSEDTTVPTEQSTAMKSALDAAGKPVELVTLKGDDHYFSHAATRTQMLEAVDAFLEKNLPPR